jgi:hypothetical protein
MQAFTKLLILTYGGSLVIPPNMKINIGSI